MHAPFAPVVWRSELATPSLSRTPGLARLWIVAAIIAGLAPGAQAKAAGADNPFLARVVGRLHRSGQDFACFSRRYDAAHLAKHPEQRVTHLKVLVDAYFREDAYQYQVSLAFDFRDRPETLTGVAECGAGTQQDTLRRGAQCAGPADGDAHLGMLGRRILVVKLPKGADLWAPGPVEERHDTVENPFGADDKVFRLFRTDVKECEDLAFDRQKPLRPHEP
jgi:hypothetical protein